MQISNAATGTVLDTETISSFSGGVYLDWTVSGNLVITITRQAGINAVLNGLFLDPTTPTPTATASFLEKDATTQGELDRHLRRRATTSSAARPACLPATRSPPAAS